VPPFRFLIVGDGSEMEGHSPRAVRKFIVRHGVSGFVAQSDTEFIAHVKRLLCCSRLRTTMSHAAREQACGESWDDVFRRVYDGYSINTFLSQNVSPKRDRIGSEL